MGIGDGERKARVRRTDGLIVRMTDKMGGTDNTYTVGKVGGKEGQTDGQTDGGIRGCVCVYKCLYTFMVDNHKTALQSTTLPRYCVNKSLWIGRISN